VAVRSKRGALDRRLLDTEVPDDNLPRVEPAKDLVVGEWIEGRTGHRRLAEAKELWPGAQLERPDKNHANGVVDVAALALAVGRQQQVWQLGVGDREKEQCVR